MRCPFLFMGVYFFQVRFEVQGEEVIISLENEGEIEGSDETANSNHSKTIIQRVLLAKDIGLISDESYHELRMSLPEEKRSVLPPISVAIKYLKRKVCLKCSTSAIRYRFSIIV